MAEARIHWVPASAAALTPRRRRVRTTTEARIAAESVVLGAAAVIMPVGIVVGVPTPIVGRAIVAVLLGLLGAAGFLVTLRGLYLSTAGVTVWRGIVPQSSIPWSEVAEFRLGRDAVHAGSTEAERLVVVRTDGASTECWFLSRRTAFEAEPLPPGDAEVVRSFPALVDQLNRIRVDASPAG